MKNKILFHLRAKYLRGFILNLLFLVVISLLSNCTKIDESTKMDITISPALTSFVIPVISSTTAGTTVADIAVNVNLDSLIKLQAPRFSPTQITNLKLTSFRLTLTDSVEAANNFGNIENVTVSLSAAGQTSNVVAALSVPDAQSGGLEIPLTATDNDLKTYFTGNQIHYILTGKMRRPTTKTLRAKLATTYRLKLDF